VSPELMLFMFRVDQKVLQYGTRLTLKSNRFGWIDIILPACRQLRVTAIANWQIRFML